ARAHLGRLEVDELAEGVAGEPGDPEHSLLALDAGPVVLLVVLQVVGIALGRGHSVLPPVDRLLDDARAARAAADVDHQLGSGLRLRGGDVSHADPDLQRRRMRARRHLATTSDRHALPRDRLLLHHEGDETPLRPLGPDAPEDVYALEFLVQRTRPAEAGGDRVGVGPDVVAMERVTDLETERVALAEAARDGASLEHGVPEPDGVLAHAQQLAAVLARVAGAIDHHLDAVERGLGEREGRRRGQPQPLDRARAL